MSFRALHFTEFINPSVMVIISPHPDDELIGCFELFEAGKVSTVFCSPCDERHRELELKELCSFYGVHCIIGEPEVNFVANHQELVLLPSPNDNQLEHKQIYYRYAPYLQNYGVYAVYMQDFFVRQCKQPQKKKELLNRFYGSQKSLWEYEQKYFLYEGRVQII